MEKEDINVDDDLYTEMTVEFSGGVSEVETFDLTPVEIILAESLLTPGLQTSVRFHSTNHTLLNGLPKNLENFKNSRMKITIDKPSLAAFNINPKLVIEQPVYRLDNRKLWNNNTEEFFLRACDPTLLNDAETLVSKSWKCTSPTSIANYALRSCAGARNVVTEWSGPPRDYIAENIHPFQVIAQQASYALSGGYDPSFLHYMTYENNGTHYFRSLRDMTTGNKGIIEFKYEETGGSINAFANPKNAMTYSFPCDFDSLSDILNGVGTFNQFLSSLILLNPFNKSFSLLGSQSYGCGVGEGVLNYAISNMNSAQQQDACPDYASVYRLKRQARMSLLDPNKVALRLVVPFNTKLNVGKLIDFNVYNKEAASAGGFIKNYGSGTYLIKSLVHNIKYGGFATTTLDCVSQTVGQGVV
jgi:hypothetical protein